MPDSRPSYPPGFRQQMIHLVRSGRTPEELSRELEPTAQTIHNWVRPDELYVADITYVPTWADFLFLAVALDVCTRRVVGWAMAS